MVIELIISMMLIVWCLFSLVYSSMLVSDSRISEFVIVFISSI